MAKKGSEPVNPPQPPMNESQVKNEQDSIASAFEQSGPGPGAASVTSTKADPTEPPRGAGTPIAEDGTVHFAEAGDDIDSLPTFQQVFSRPISEADLAAKFKAAGVKKKKRDEVELAKKKSNDAFTKEINQLQAEIDGLLNQANAGGEEKEVTCRKRVDYDRAVVTIFDAKSLEIMERRQLNLKELQVEMRWAGKVPPGKQGDYIAGPWPTDSEKPPEATADATAPAAAPAEAEAQTEGTTAAEGATPANPVDSFTLPQSELDKQAPRKRGRPPKAKPETAPAPGSIDKEFQDAGAE